MSPHFRLRPAAWLAIAATGVLVLILAAVLLLRPAEEPDYALPVVEPVRATTPISEGIADLVDPAWVTEVAAATGIPERALAAYAGAAILKAERMPECRLGWTTLAAIGFAESRHGTHDGSSIGADGTVTPPIYGSLLDGTDSDHIPDSDGGAFDGSAEFDRAMGPLQFIPEAWANWGGDANADGVIDPQNIDDASFAASNYLCRASGDMVTREGWRTGIAAFNSAPSYLLIVAEAANRYARDAGVQSP